MESVQLVHISWSIYSRRPHIRWKGSESPRFQVLPGFLCATEPFVAPEDPFPRMFHPECPQEKEVCGIALDLLNCSYRQAALPHPTSPRPGYAHVLSIFGSQ